MTDELRSFVVGETVHLWARVSRPGSKQPYSPDIVRLTGLSRNGVAVILPDTVDFATEKTGEFHLVLHTADLAVGTYHIVVLLSDGPDAVRIMEDDFVLSAIGG